jgi:hypothetical protein
MFNVYTDYNQSKVSFGSLGECLDYIKDNCINDVLAYGSNTIVYWLDMDHDNKAICEITYVHSMDALQLVFVGAYGELCGSHKFLHQLKV